MNAQLAAPLKILRAAALSLLLAAASLTALALEDISKENLILGMSESGMQIGNFVWLRYPMRDITIINTLPGLSKIQIKDFDVRQKYKFSATQKNVVMIVDFEGAEHIIELSPYAFSFRPTDYVEKFYLEDPSKRVAKWGKRILKAIADRKVFVGMTPEQVEASWGRPTRVHSSGGRSGSRQQWVYGETSATYLYFESGRLSNWQD